MRAIPERRSRYRKDARYFRKCRRRYARMLYRTWRKVPDDRMANWLDFVAAAGIRRGFWSMGFQTPRQQRLRIIPKTAMNAARYTILKVWRELDGVTDWREVRPWMAANGFSYYTFQYTGRRLKVA